MTQPEHSPQIENLRSFSSGVSSDSVPAFGVDKFTKEVVAPDHPTAPRGILDNWTQIVRHQINMKVVQDLQLTIDPFDESEQNKNRVSQLTSQLAKAVTGAVRDGLGHYKAMEVWDTLTKDQDLSDPKMQKLREKYLEILTPYRIIIED